MKHALLYGTLGLLFFVLQKDFWLWKNATLIWGIPVHLLYQICLCLILSATLWVVTRTRWPDHIDLEE